MKQAQITLRLKPETKDMLKRAASIEGKTLNSFILASAAARAEETTQAHETMRLSARDASAFFEAVDKPVRFTQKLRSAFKEHQPLHRGG